MDEEPRTDPMWADDAPSTDDVLSESVERVRSSRRLIDRLDHRLQRSQRLLDGDSAGDATA